MEEADKERFTVTIGRPVCGDGREFIRIEVRDTKSRVKFLELEVGYSAFTELLTGRSEVGCKGELRHLERVGKRKYSKPVIIEIPRGELGRSRAYAELEVRQFLCGGYVAHSGFGSQNSFFTEGGVRYARTAIFKYE